MVGLTGWPYLHVTEKVGVATSTTHVWKVSVHVCMGCQILIQDEKGEKFRNQ